MNVMGTVLNKHTSIFSEMLQIDKKQLQILPTLQPIPQSKSGVGTIPNNETRDPIYEMKNYMKDIRRF